MNMKKSRQKIALKSTSSTGFREFGTTGACPQQDPVASARGYVVCCRDETRAP
jgi:hypothetical protein